MNTAPSFPVSPFAVFHEAPVQVIHPLYKSEINPSPLYKSMISLIPVNF